MTIYQSLMSQLKRRSLPEIQKVSDATGVPYHTIAKIRREETKNPGILTIQPLLDYFKGRKK